MPLFFVPWGLELCGAFVVALGIFQMMHSRFASLIVSFWPIYPANTLVVTGTIVTCVCYLGVLGGMKENSCMLISVSTGPAGGHRRQLERSTSIINITVFSVASVRFSHRY